MHRDVQSLPARGEVVQHVVHPSVGQVVASVGDPGSVQVVIRSVVGPVRQVGQPYVRHPRCLVHRLHLGAPRLQTPSDTHTPAEDCRVGKPGRQRLNLARDPHRPPRARCRVVGHWRSRGAPKIAVGRPLCAHTAGCEPARRRLPRKALGVQVPKGPHLTVGAGGAELAALRPCGVVGVVEVPDRRSRCVDAGERHARLVVATARGPRRIPVDVHRRGQEIVERRDD